MAGSGEEVGRCHMGRPFLRSNAARKGVHVSMRCPRVLDPEENLLEPSRSPSSTYSEGSYDQQGLRCARTRTESALSLDCCFQSLETKRVGKHSRRKCSRSQPLRERPVSPPTPQPPPCMSPAQTLLICDASILNFPRYPKLGTQHPESNSAGNDVFAKFSAFIKNTKKDTNESEYLTSSCPGFFTRTAPCQPSGVASKILGVLTNVPGGRDLYLEIRKKCL